MDAADLAAARERHVRCTPDKCWFTGFHKCDAARFRDALDEMTAARDGYADLVDTLSEQEAAARALADELAEALDAYPRDFHRQAHDKTIDWRECQQPSCTASSAALAKWEASRG